MQIGEVAFLGPLGTFSHLVAEAYYGRRKRMVPLPTILDVCAFVSKSGSRRGVIPIENSSGGEIYETVDILLANRPRIHIEAELSLEVQLALLGHKGWKIKTLYSHFAPLEHCASWLKRHLPHVQRHVVASTAADALQAMGDLNAAALGNRKLAEIYRLDILAYPIQADVKNLTIFLAISGRRPAPRRVDKTTLAVRLPNRPGALCTFLEAFRNAGVNLSRIISRPIRGSPRQYAFLVDVDGSPLQPATARALADAKRAADELRIVGYYPCYKPYRF
ncbi:MAG: ACT domain-containing protein [Kiritimatiellae bacterium]|nr:ACT domain-containing protein [Kiritimatiellia bacterium]